MALNPYHNCDKILQYLFNKNKNCERTEIEHEFKPDNILPSLDELSSTTPKLIANNNSKTYYHILPEGQNIIINFGCYSAFKKSKEINFVNAAKLVKEQREDLPKSKKDRKKNIILSILALIIAILTFILMFK